MNLSLILRQFKWRMGLKSPIVSNIKITNVCNLRCKMCNPSIRTEGHKEPDTKAWKETLQRLWKKGVRIVVFEGGEPTLRKDIGDLILFAKELGLKVILITNGTRDFSELNPDTLWISIDGIKNHHEAVRGKGTYEKIKENMAKIPNKNITILSMINRLNMNDIGEFVREFADYPIYFNWMYEYGDIEVKSMSEYEKRHTSQLLKNLKKEGYRIFNSYKTLESVGSRKKCAYWLLNTVDSGGEIYEGCMVKKFDKNCKCKECDLACYIELNNIYGLDYETRKNWQDMTGFDLTFKLEEVWNKL